MTKILMQSIDSFRNLTGVGICFISLLLFHS